MLNWDPKNNNPKVKGFLEECLRSHLLGKNKAAELFTYTDKYGSKICRHKYLKTYGTMIQTFGRKPGRCFMNMQMKLWPQCTQSHWALFTSVMSRPKVTCLARIIPSVFWSWSVTWIVIQTKKQLLTRLQMAPVQQQISECWLSTWLTTSS